MADEGAESMKMKGIARNPRLKRGGVALLTALAAGVVAATALPSTGAGSSSFPDMRGAYHQYACVGGTLAQCEANPQYPSTFTVATEDFSTGAIALTNGETGTISGCTMTFGPTITNSMPANPYQSQAHYNISADTSHLTGTFDDTYGRRGQPIYANRDAAGPDMCPPGGTTTTTTPTGPALTRTATQVMCNYFVATNDDVCTATVGDATGAGTTPTGRVVFSGDRTGQCTLAATPLSPGVASCSITVIGTQNFLNVTAAYQGDATQAGSTGATKFLSAPVGNGLYNPTIQPFSPNTISLLDNNPVPRATVTGQLELTGTDATECSSASTPSTGRDYAAGNAASARRTVVARTLTASATIKNARRGKVRLHLKLNPAKARALFKPNQTLLLIVKVIVKPRHGKSLVGTTLERVRLKFTKHRVLVVKAPASRRAKEAEAPKCAPGATITLARSRNDSGSGWFGTLNMTVVIPPGVPNSPERNAATTATLSGSITLICRKIPTPTKTAQVNVSETFSGGLSSPGLSPAGISYKLSLNPNLRWSVYTNGTLPAPPSGDPSYTCPPVDLQGNLEQLGDVTQIPVPTSGQ